LLQNQIPQHTININLNASELRYTFPFNVSSTTEMNFVRNTLDDNHYTN